MKGTNKTALVYGMGRSGRGALRLLCEQAANGKRDLPLWYDTSPQPADLALAEELGLQRCLAPSHSGVSLVVAAPGVPPEHPDLRALQAGGAEIIGELELAFRATALPLIAVTGTAGKGGTSLLIWGLLRAAGLRAEIGGNIDPPLCDVVGRTDAAGLLPQVLVAEASSFQLERCFTLKPKVAVVTNLGVDHLDRHGTVEHYHAAKLNVTRQQDESDVLVAPQALKERCSAVSRARLHTFAPSPPALQGLALPARHHPANVSAALVACESFLGRPLSAAELQEGLSVAPQGGRFEEVLRVQAGSGELSFVDDSIATRADAVCSALLRAKGPVVWLLGGRDKGADLSALQEALPRVSHVLAFGEDGPRMAQALGLPFVQVNNQDPAGLMRDLVQQAAGLLPNGGTVLLSPLGTSFDMYRDYRARGDAFAVAAKAYARAQGHEKGQRKGE